MAKLSKSPKTANPQIRSAPQTPEDLLRDYFAKEGIVFLYKERKIDLEPGSTQRFVLPDFYLPELEIPVEIMHHWDDPKFRPRNMAKLELYARADIPCIFIYPKDLPQLDTLFSQKLAEARKQQYLQQHQQQEWRFSLTVAVVCLLIGIALIPFRYTRILGVIAVSYGTVLLLMRHPALVATTLKKIGKHLVLFLKLLGMGMVRLLIILWQMFTIISKTLWKLLKLFAIYAWIAVKTIVRAIAFIVVHIWYGLLTGIVWLWHGFVWSSYKCWRGLLWSSRRLGRGIVIVGKGIGIGVAAAGKWSWIGIRYTARGLWIGLLYVCRGALFVLRAIWQGVLLSIHAFGAGVYRAKHSIQEKAKERRLAQLDAQRSAREAAKLAKEKQRTAKEKTTKKPKRRKGKAA